MKYFYTSFTKIAQWISLVQSHITRYVTHYNFFFQHIKMTNTKGIENLKELEKLETELKRQEIKRTEREKLEKIVKVKIKKVKELKTLEIQKLELERQLLNEKEQIDIATEIGNITKKVFVIIK